MRPWLQRLFSRTDRSARQRPALACEPLEARWVPYTSPLGLGSIAGLGGAAGYVLQGAGATDLTSLALGAAGDVNGDGFDDQVVGSASGAAYVVFGRSDGGGGAVSVSSIAAGSGGFVIQGDAATRAGRTAAGAGDVNGDGLADLLIGAAEADVNGTDSGAAFVVFGKTSTTAVPLSAIALGLGGFAINGAAAGDRAGSAVAGAGDVNGDGLADLLIGAPDAAAGGVGAGAAYLVFGKADGTAVALAALGSGGFVVSGSAAGDRAGSAVAGAGDVNGDGLADLIVGAPLADPNGADSGAGYVVFGKTNVSAVSLAALGSGGFALNGAVAGDRAGSAVAGAGDVNGDGLSDLVVGAPLADPTGAESGAAYVVLGKSGTGAVALSAVATGAGGFVINGAGAGDRAGMAVGGAGDFNGDGLADVIVGAPYADPGGNESGSAYLVFGKTSTTAMPLSSLGRAVQTDTFEDGTTHNWAIGAGPGPVNVATGGPAGADDNFMRLTANGGGPGGRLTVFNRIQWAGNLLTKGINAVEVDLKNLGTTPLSIRIALKQFLDFGSPGFSSTTGFPSRPTASGITRSFPSARPP